MAIALASPMRRVADTELFSVHAFQHLLITLAAPPLLIAGTPGWLFRAPLRSQAIFRLAKFITLPLVAPLVLLGVTFRTMDTFRLFDTPFVLNGNQDGQPTTTGTRWTASQTRSPLCLNPSESHGKYSLTT